MGAVGEKLSRLEKGYLMEWLLLLLLGGRAGSGRGWMSVIGMHVGTT